MDSQLTPSGSQRANPAQLAAVLLIMQLPLLLPLLEAAVLAQYTPSYFAEQHSRYFQADLVFNYVHIITSFALFCINSLIIVSHTSRH